MAKQVAVLIQEYIFYASIAGVLVASVVGVARYRRLETERRYLVWLSLLALLVTVVAIWLQRQHRPNLFLAPIDTAIEFTLLMLIYRRVLQPLSITRYLGIGIGLFVVGTAISYRPQLVEFNPIQRFIESLVVLALVVLYFRREYQRPVPAAALEHEPMLWISAGLLLYFSGNILIFLSSNAVLHLSREISRHVWAIHALLYAFLNVFYTVALCVTPRPAARHHTIVT